MLKKKVSQLEIIPKIEKAANEKKGRILTLVLLTGTIVLTLSFWLLGQWRRGQLSFPHWSVDIKKPSFNLPDGNNQDLPENLDQWARENLSQLPGQWAIRVEFLNSDFVWSWQGEQSMPATSLIKLPVVAAFYRQVEMGKLELEDIHVLKSSEMIAGSGSLQNQAPGTKVSLGELARLALSQSDNTAFAILRDLVGKQEIDDYLSVWGMEETSLEDNLTSAKDVAVFFQSLYQNKILSEEFSQKMLEDMTKTIYEDRIPAGVPEGIRVAHKVGSEVGVVSDAGIVYVPGKPFILVILSQDTKEATAKEAFPELANQIYWLLTNNY
ncbi:MAG: serine hydrolase [Patescibacteria group bacterium]